MHEYSIVKKSHMDAFHFVNYLLYLPQKQHHKHDEHKTFPHIYRLTAFYMAWHAKKPECWHNQARYLRRNNRSKHRKQVKPTRISRSMPIPPVRGGVSSCNQLTHHIR